MRVDFFMDWLRTILPGRPRNATDLRALAEARQPGGRPPGARRSKPAFCFFTEMRVIQLPVEMADLEMIIFTNDLHFIYRALTLELEDQRRVTG